MTQQERDAIYKTLKDEVAKMATNPFLPPNVRAALAGVVAVIADHENRLDELERRLEEVTHG